MKTLFRVLFLSLLSFTSFAQIQTFKGDTAATTQATRLNIGANAAGRPGFKGSTGNFKAFATIEEVNQLTGGSVATVNGKTGPTVTLVTSDINEGTNLYFTLARMRAGLSATTPISYNSSTGAFSWVGTKSDVGLGNVDNTADLSKPISNLTQTALNAKEGSITAGTTSQYYRGDKTWATHDKTSIGLANVDNTSDLSKPISNLTQTALNAKQDAASAIFRVDVATYAALTAYTVPAGLTYLIKVAADESQSAPYTVNQWYLKDGTTGTTFKLTLSKQ